jgi:hypothetical protein
LLETRIAARQHDASDATVAVLHAVRRGNPRGNRQGELQGKLQGGNWLAVDASDATSALAQARAAVRATG